MKAIINKLEEATVDFKSLFIERTIEWAKQTLANNIERRNAYRTIDHKRKDSQYYAEQKFYWNSPSWFFTEEFVSKSVAKAEQHYKDSIEKLAYRIQEKGLKLESLKVSSVFLGVNLDLTITDGTKAVTAKTILAWGEINRPHYRYLVK